jgi:hypothetical protein
MHNDAHKLMCEVAKMLETPLCVKTYQNGNRANISCTGLKNGNQPHQMLPYLFVDKEEGYLRTHFVLSPHSQQKYGIYMMSHTACGIYLSSGKF